eukprot:1160952-Pelagomonas_calceolata.AAC.4
MCSASTAAAAHQPIRAGVCAYPYVRYGGCSAATVRLLRGCTQVCAVLHLQRYTPDLMYTVLGAVRLLRMNSPEQVAA